MRIIPVVIMLLLFCEVGVCTELKPPSPTPLESSKKKQTIPKYGNQNTDSEKQISLPNPVTVKILPSPDAEAQAAKQAKYEEKKASNDDLLVWSTVILALVTTVLAVFTGFLWKATRQLVAESRISSQAIQRAFVFIKKLEVIIIPDPKRLIIIPQWENSGDTPTKNMLNHVNWFITPQKLPADFDFPDLPGEERAPTLIGPHAIQYASQLEIDSKHIDEVVAGTGHLYIWGWAEYNDVFAGTSRHRTEFCNEVLISRILDKEISIRFRLYRKHNGADEECTKKASPYIV